MKNKNGHYKCNICGEIQIKESEIGCHNCIKGEMIFIGYRTDISTKNNRGQFVPSIPEPLFIRFGRTQCECGKKFRNRKEYRAHYALEHILGLD